MYSFSEKTVFDTNCAGTFIYGGNSYTGCTTVNNGGVPWCSLTPNYDLDGQYANCAVPLTCVKAGGGKISTTLDFTTWGKRWSHWAKNLQKQDGGHDFNLHWISLKRLCNLGGLQYLDFC